MKPPIVPIEHIAHTHYEYKCNAKQIKALINYCLSKRYWFQAHSCMGMDGKFYFWFKCGVAPDGFSKRSIKLTAGGITRHAADSSTIASGSK